MLAMSSTSSLPQCSDLVEWRSRQDTARDLLLAATKKPVSDALDWIQRDKLLHLLEDGGGRVRRAVVLYLDQGSSGLQQLHWWIKAWTFIGLDQTDQAFDVVVMAHPKMVEKVSKMCTRIAENFSPRHSGPGRCLYKPYIGVANRDSAYDKYMSSQECLVGPGSEFLQDYRILLRSDILTTMYQCLAGGTQQSQPGHFLLLLFLHLLGFFSSSSLSSSSGRTWTPSPPLACWTSGPRVSWWTGTPTRLTSGWPASTRQKELRNNLSPFLSSC